MIESPLLVESDRRWREQRLDPVSKRRIAGRGVAKLVQLWRETVEIVNRRRGIHRGDRSAGNVPVRRNREHAFGLRSSAPIAVQASVYSLCSSAFIGLPCPKKTAGIVGPITTF